MTQFKQVPASLVFQAQPLEDIELVSPESLFEDFENDNSETDITLSSPDELFANIDKTEIKLKSPEELWGKVKSDRLNRNNSARNRKPLK
ncbi:hypothetical protein EON78_05960 [bacterium]|nr:MAG: hypothetical protein EON78_05960 [bacterium]